MGKVKQLLKSIEEERLLRRSVLYRNCICRPEVDGLDELCPVCLAEYESLMETRQKQLIDAGILILPEKKA